MDDFESLSKKRTADLAKANEAMRSELARLRAQSAELARRLHEMSSEKQADRESRRAALNLMEDAVNARRAEELEIQERKRVEAELREEHRRKDEFLATLAHELRNPLAPIRNSLHILRVAGGRGWRRRPRS